MSSMEKEGLLKKKDAAWHERYVVLAGGSLHFYKGQLKPEAYETFQLKTCTIETYKSKSISNAIVIKADKSAKGRQGLTECLIAAKQADVIKNWQTAIEACLDKDPTEAPVRDVGKKGTALSRAGKSMKQAAATSGAGKRLLKSKLPEVFIFLDYIKEFVAHINEKGRAKEIKGNILTLAVKIALLYNDKVLTASAFKDIKFPIIRLWSCYVDYCDMPFAIDIPEVVGLANNVKKSLETTLKEHVTPKTLSTMKETFEYLLSEEMLTKIFDQDDEKLEDLRSKSSKMLRDFWDSRLSENDKRSVHEMQADRSYAGEKKSDWT